jgi:LmbE family N-acetylglucosaminyl deacetylase
MFQDAMAIFITAALLQRGPRMRSQLSVLCAGVRSDDIEIGASGTLLGLIAGGAEVKT